MTKIFKYLILVCILLIPNGVSAKDIRTNESKLVKVSEITKYYKTVITSGNLNSNNNKKDKKYITVEISEDEYNNADNYSNNKGDGASGTEYKSLTTTIYSNGNNYRYEATLNWKKMPSNRSYDIIAIGNLSNVIYSGTPNFSQYYCTTSGLCRTINSYYPKMTSTGCGATFQLPSGDLSILKETLSFDVEKNTSSTIVYQAAYGDYAHSTSTVTPNQARDYNIGSSITFNNGVGVYFDNISTAVADWSGIW